MTGKICIRLVGTLTCIAMTVAGWDAEAGWRRHHRHASRCCETVCDPCCVPVCETVCDPCCAPVCVARYVEPSRCCRTEWVSTVIEETVIVPARQCCDGRVVANEAASSVTPRPIVESGTPTPAQQPDRASVTTTSAPSSSRLVRTATTR